MSEVADTLARFLLALDDHDWESVSGCLAATVRRDYRSLTGADPDEVGGPELAAQWKGMLEGLDTHQHLLGLPHIEVDGDTARAAAHVVATHVLADDPGSPWVVAGTYRFELTREDETWRIAGLKLDTRWQTGDPELLQRV